jgi:hypothetical protein
MIAMKRVQACMTLLICLCLLIIGCTGGKARSETQRNYDFDSFNKIEVSSAFHVEVIQSNSYSITITAQEKLFDHITVVKTGDTLGISMKWSFGTWLSSWGFRSPKARITMPVFTGLEISGASKGTAKGFISSEDLTLVISGASSLEVDMEVKDADIEVSGASHLTGVLKSGDIKMEVTGASGVELDGSGNNLDINVSGASRANLEEFTVNNADTAISGASRAVISAESKITVELSGASSLDYTGNPDINVKDISGASTIRKK